MLTVADSVDKTSSNSNGTSDYLRHWETLSSCEEIQGNKDGNSLECISYSSRNWTQTSQDNVLEVIVHVVAHTTNYNIHQEGLLVWYQGWIVVCRHNLIIALEVKDKGQGKNCV